MTDSEDVRYAHTSRDILGDILPHHDHLRMLNLRKATLFVANQNTLDALPIKALADETDLLLERTKTLAAEIKAASALGAAWTRCRAK